MSLCIVLPQKYKIKLKKKKKKSTQAENKPL